MYFGARISSTLVVGLTLLSSAVANPIPVPAADAAAAVTIDERYWYALRNDYQPSLVLDVKNYDYQLSLKAYPTELASCMYWKFTRVTPSDTTPKYRLRTMYLGDGYSLDVWNDNGVSSTDLRLRETGNYSGQQWTITPWGDGSFRLSNNYTGPDKHFDTYADTLTAFLGIGNASGQHWHFDKISRI